MDEPTENVYRAMRIMQLMRMLENETKRARYYAEAAEEVKKIEHLTVNNYHELNVGNKIQKYIYNILNGKGMDEIESLSDEQYEKFYSMSQFIEIKGIGIKKAEKLYNEGIRTLKELENSSNITKMTKIAMEHEKDLKQRVKRETIDQWLIIFDEIIGSINDGNTSLFISPAGSYSRGEKTSGDLDVILSSDIDNEPRKYISEIIDKLYETGIIIQTLISGNDKFEGIGYINGEPNFQVDIEIANTRDTYPYKLLYFTGSAKFVTNMRNTAKKMGYHLTNSEMLDDDGNRVYVESEREIFHILNVEYIPPEMRI